MLAAADYSLHKPSMIRVAWANFSNVLEKARSFTDFNRIGLSVNSLINYVPVCIDVQQQSSFQCHTLFAKHWQKTWIWKRKLNPTLHLHVNLNDWVAQTWSIDKKTQKKTRNGCPSKDRRSLQVTRPGQLRMDEGTCVRGRSSAPVSQGRRVLLQQAPATVHDPGILRVLHHTHPHEDIEWLNRLLLSSLSISPRSHMLTLTSFGASLTVRHFAIEFIRRHFHVGLNLINGDVEMFFYVSEILHTRQHKLYEHVNTTLGWR